MFLIKKSRFLGVLENEMCYKTGRVRTRDFTVPRMIELACQTFMPIQTLDLHRLMGEGNFQFSSLRVS